MIADITVDSESETLTKEAIWNRRDKAVQRGFSLSETTLVDALPGTGKSFGVVKWAAQTEKKLTVLAPRHDLLDEYQERCNNANQTVNKFPSFYRDCASFEKNDQGKYEPIDARARDLEKEYKKGRGGAELHKEYNDLTCQEDDECPFMDARCFDPDEYDVLLGTYRHAHREDWIDNRYVVFDEFPEDAFLTTFDEGVPAVVSAYLEETDELPFINHSDLSFRDWGQPTKDSIEEWKDALDPSLVDQGHPCRSPNTAAHTLGPMTALAVIEAEQLSNGWQYANLGEGRVAVRNPKDEKWTFLLPPDLSSAKSVIALDGTPNITLWELVLNEQIYDLPLFSHSEKQSFLRDVLELRFIQTTERWKAINSGEGAAPPKDLALIEGVAQREGTTPALISSQKGLRKYERAGLNEITQKTEYYNNLKGMNGFATERLGIILGCPHPRDDKIEKWSALAGESAKRRTENGEPTTGNDVDYGPFGNRVARTFIHDEVLQAAMRFGREEEDGFRGATVYIHTSAFPEWVPLEDQIPKIHRWQTEKDGVRDVIKAIKVLEAWRHREWKATELYDYTSISEKQVRNCLESLAEEGYLKFCGKKGQGGSLHYRDRRLDEAGWFGHVEFPE